MSNNKGSSSVKIPWFMPGDMDAMVGTFFDGFTKILVGVSVMVGVMQMPSDVVFSKVVVGIGLSAFLLLAFSTFMARQKGIKENHTTITALPAGISGGTFFVWLNAIMIPTYFATGDYMMALKVALCANLLHSLIIFISSFFIKAILKYIPNQAMLAGLVGGSMCWLLLSSMGEAYVTPYVVIPTLFILLTFYFAKIEIKKLSPASAAVGVGIVIAWATGVMKIEGLMESFNTVGLYLPSIQIGLISADAFSMALKFLPIILAFAFTDMTSMIQGIEQAELGGDNYDRRTCLISVSLTNVIGAMFGNPFIMTYYWGHPAWKQAKAGTSYALYTGIVYLVLCATGLVAIATSIIPVSATMVLLMYVAMTSGAQAFESTDKKYYPAMIVGVAVPVFELMYGKVNSAIAATQNAIGDALVSSGIDFSVGAVEVTTEYLSASGIPFGYEILSQGSMCIAILYVAALVFITDRKWVNTAVTFLVASGCAFIGLIHSGVVTLYASPMYVWIYLGMAVLFLVIHMLDKNKSKVSKV